MASLGTPNCEPPNLTTNETSGLRLLRQVRRAYHLDRSLSITKFFKAFGLYKHIMSKAYPQCKLKLDLYEADIGSIYEHYGDIFYQCHCQFTKKAAAYLEKGIRIDWSMKDIDLSQLIVGVQKLNCVSTVYKVITSLHSALHSMQSSVLSPKKQTDLMGKNFNSKLDRKDCRRKEICNNFNNNSSK